MDDRYFWVGFTAFTQEKMASVDGLPAPVKLRTKPSVSALRSRAFYEVPGWFFYGRYCARSEWNVRHAAEFIETVVKNTEDETPFNDIERLQNNSKLKPTTKKRLIDSRLGQGRFREEVMRRWHRACAVTGCRLKQILRASHIKPWSRSNSREQLDPANGILLLANIDALFDARLVTFDDDGKMIISQRIDHKNRKELGIPANLRRKPDARERRYLAEHRRVFRST
jgi:predicted restriction endonuclease